MREPAPFGKYVLLERISVGGMAEVFKAKAFGVEGFEKILAIKRILPSLAEDGDFIDMFIDEAKICGQLNHANICQIFELGRVGDAHFIAMEYVWGKDLLQIQNRHRKLRKTMKPDMAAFIAARMCEGLDYAHKKKDSSGKPLGVIHRDISPQNILVSYEGEIKIIDFGIAKAATRSSRTQAGVLKGKFGYMSPEQVRGLPLDRRSDVFAIGTILYELLIADRLFVGESDFETLERVRNVDVPPVSKRNPAVQPQLEQIIQKALAKDVEDRYQYASEMLEALQVYLSAIEPAFTTKQLSGWMREQFGVEMKREQDILDEQRRIGKELLSQSPAPSRPAAPAAAAAAQQPSASASANIPALPPPPTPVAQAAAAPRPATATPLRASDLFEGEPSSSDELHGEKTTVTAPLEEALPAQATALIDRHTGSVQLPKLNGSGAPAGPAAPSGGELKSEATVVFGDKSGSVQMPKIGPAQSTLMAEAPPNLPSIMTSYPQPMPVPVTHRAVAPLSMPPMAQRSTLWKDVAIGVGVAAAVVGGVLGARAYFGHAGAHGTLVVMANPPRAADVVVDGKARGHLEAGAPLTLRDVPAGDHRVIVRGADGSEFRQTVALAAGDVSVISAAMLPVSAVGTGNLTLKMAEGAAEVYVDGAQLSDGAWKRPIPLRADAPHEIRVARPQTKEVRFTLTLKAGEERTRDVTFEAAIGKVNIVTDPAGAEVVLNGKKVGVTPATIDEIDATKPARLTVRHRGFAPITKYINFEKGLEQAFEIKMVVSTEDGFGAASPEGEVVADKVDKPVHASPSHDKPAAPLVPRPIAVMESDTPPAPGPRPLRDRDAPSDEVTPLKPVAAKGTEPGYLVANTQPWAKVIIDGKDTGKTTPIAPRSKIALKPGKHVVTFLANGKKFNFDVVIKSAEDTRLIKQLTDSP